MLQPCRPEIWTFQCGVSLRTAGTVRELVDNLKLCCSMFSESEEEQARGRRSSFAQNPDQVCSSRVCDWTLAAVGARACRTGTGWTVAVARARQLLLPPSPKKFLAEALLLPHPHVVVSIYLCLSWLAGSGPCR